MPWTPSSFAKKHNKSLKSAAARRQASKIANDVLKRTGDDGRAIRIANGVIRRRQQRRR